MTFLRTLYARWRFHRCFRHLDRQIADARKAHRPVAHLLRAKSEFVHAALRGGL